MVKGPSKVMEIDSDKLKEYILFHLHRKTTNLYKQFLFILEDLRDDKYTLKDPKIYQQIRKRVLDLGNDSQREMEEHFQKLEINLKIKDY